MPKKKKAPWVRVRHKVFSDLNSLTTGEKMAWAKFMLDSNRRNEAIRELLCMRLEAARKDDS